MIYLSTNMGIIRWDEKDDICLVDDQTYFSVNKWHDFFVVVHSEMKGFNEGQEAKVLIKDNNFNPIAEHFIGTSVKYVHQSRVQGDELFIADTGNDRVVIHNLLSNSTRFLKVEDDHTPQPNYYIRKNNGGLDRRHVNTVMPDGDRLFVVCHNYGASYLLEFKDGRIIGKVEDIGVNSHDLWKDNGKLWSCSSLEGRACSIDKAYSIVLTGFVRGCVKRPGVQFLGSSHVRTDNPTFKALPSRPGIYILRQGRTEFFDLLPLSSTLQIFDMMDGDL